MLALAIVIYGQLDMRSHRFAGIIKARSHLKYAAADFERTGSVTNYGDYRVWLNTNAIAVDGTNYGCQFMIQVHEFYGEGTLAQTTNGFLIWLGNGKPAKFITADYRPKLFPPGF